MRFLIDLLAGALVALSLLVPRAHAQAPSVPFTPNINGQAPRPVVWTPVLLNSLGATVVSVVSSQAARLTNIYCYNPTGAVAYLQIFDVATAAGVTLNSTVPTLSLGIPTAQASGLGPAVTGIYFKNGIQVASTTTPTGNSAAVQHCNAAYN